MDKNNRRIIIRITPQLLSQLFINGERHFIIENGVPKTATMVGAWWNHERGCWDIVYQDKSFKLVKEGEQYPQVYPEYKNM